MDKAPQARSNGLVIGILLRSAVMLAIAVPVFVALGFRPALWQILVVAVVGALAARLAWRATQTRSRSVQLGVIAFACLAAIGGALGFGPWLRGAEASAHDGFLVVANREEGLSRRSLTMDDADALTAQARLVVPVARYRTALVAEEANWNVDVKGTTPAFFDLRSWRTADGVTFTQADVDASAKVVVLGPETARQLFGKTNAVGQSVRIHNVPFSVVGVLASKRQLDDDAALVPLTTFRAKLSGGATKVFDGVLLVAGAEPEAVRGLLRDRHRLAPGDEDDFVVRDLR